MRLLILSIFLTFSILINAKQQQGAEINTINALAKRIVKGKSTLFHFKSIKTEKDEDVFEIETKNGKVEIGGNSSISMAAGLNYYLKNYCNNSISWLGNNINLPAKLPTVSPKITISSQYIYRPYMNYCTLGYSAPFWDWKRWEKELDWMAMNGINMPLLIIGQEAVWQNVLKQFNFTNEEIAGFIPGPTHAPWWLMQNLEGEGGPVSQAYINARVALQQKIIKRAKELGMKPIFQGFFGMVPTLLSKKYPEEKIYNTGIWAGGYQRPAQLNPESKLFGQLAKAWYTEQSRLYGTASFYGGDPFHEGTAPKDVDLVKTGTIIQSYMLKANTSATWVLQCWQDKPYDLMLDGTDPEKVLILELSGEGYKFWQKRNNPKFKWAYSIINNYGGKQGIYGRFDKVVADLNYYMNHANEKNLKGIGITPEGIENNPAAYEMIFDYVWKKKVTSVSEYIKKYTLTRYGSYDAKIDSAWKIMMRTAYNCQREQEGTTESVLCARPSLNLKRVSTWSGADTIYYSIKEFNKVLNFFISASDKFRNVETYRYDLVDITRQCIANKARLVYADIVNAYQKKDRASFVQNTKLFIELIVTQDKLMGTLNEFLLGKWIKDARQWGQTPAEKELMEYNAKLLITLWRKNRDTPLHEYSHREWNGLLGSLYKLRWEMFFNFMAQKMDGKTPKEINFFEIENQWIQEKNTSFQFVPTGDPIQICKEINKNYFSEQMYQ